MNITQAELRRMGWKVQGNQAVPITKREAGGPKTVKAFLNLPIISEANANGKLRDSLRRKAEQKAVVVETLGEQIANRGQPKSVLLVLLTTHLQDDDNLARSFKSIRDQIAELCGMKSDAAKIWKYDQAELRPWESRGVWCCIKWA